MKKILTILILLLCWASGAGAATWYVDKRCTYNGDGTAETCAAGAGAAGAWNTFTNPTSTTYVNSTNDHTINIVAGSGPYYPSDGFSATSGFAPAQTNAYSKTMTWNFNNNTLQFDFDINAQAGLYQWNESSVSGWYYLQANGGGQPQIPTSHIIGAITGNITTVRSAIINGSWSATSTNLAGIMTLYGRYATDNWCWGDYDTLGYSTLYVKTSGNINTIEVLISQMPYNTYRSTSRANTIINNCIFSGTNGTDSKALVTIGSKTTFYACTFVNADGHAIEVVNAGASDSATYACNFINCGHRGIYVSAQANFTAIKNTFVNCHLALLMNSDTAHTIIFKLNTTYNLLAGAISKAAATSTLTETNNVFHLDKNSLHGSVRIGFYQDPSYWAATDTTDNPSAADTSLLCTGNPANCGTDPLLRDPTNGIYSLQANSPTVNNLSAADATTLFTGLPTFDDVSGRDCWSGTALEGPCANGVSAGAYEEILYERTIQYDANGPAIIIQ